MAVPSAFSELSTTPASNSGLISDASSVNTIDDHLRAIYAFIASVYANSGNGWSSPFLTAANPSYTGTLTGGTGVVNLGSGQFYKAAGGNVGLGTTSPLAALHVATATARVLVAPSTAANSAYLALSNTSGDAFIGIGGTDGALVVGALNIYHGGAQPIVMYTGGIERARLDGTGVRLANVASAPSAPSSGGALYVEGGALKFIGSSGTVTTLAPA